MKQATADLDQARRIVDDTGLVLYAGNDDLLLPFLELGGAGGICVASHVAGREMRPMVDLARPAATSTGARALDASAARLYAGLAVTTNPIPVKAALNLLGHDVGGLRLPLVAADAGETQAVGRSARGLRHAGESLGHA